MCVLYVRTLDPGEPIALWRKEESPTRQTVAALNSDGLPPVRMEHFSRAASDVTNSFFGSLSCFSMTQSPRPISNHKAPDDAGSSHIAHILFSPERNYWQFCELGIDELITNVTPSLW